MLQGTARKLAFPCLPGLRHLKAEQLSRHDSALKWHRPGALGRIHSNGRLKAPLQSKGLMSWGLKDDNTWRLGGRAWKVQGTKVARRNCLGLNPGSTAG